MPHVARTLGLALLTLPLGLILLAFIQQVSFRPAMIEAAELRVMMGVQRCQASDGMLREATSFNRMLAIQQRWNTSAVFDLVIPDGWDSVTAIQIPPCGSSGALPDVDLHGCPNGPDDAHRSAHGAGDVGLGAYRLFTEANYPDALARWNLTDWERYSRVQLSGLRMVETLLLPVDQGVLDADALNQLGYTLRTNVALVTPGFSCIWADLKPAVGPKLRDLIDKDIQSERFECKVNLKALRDSTVLRSPKA